MTADEKDGRFDLKVPLIELKRWKHAAIDLEISTAELIRRAVTAYLNALEAGSEIQVNREERNR